MTIFLARYWDESQPLDPVLMPDHCHRCHTSVARRAGLLTSGPCYVLCPECYNRVPAVWAGRTWPRHAAWPQRLPHRVKIALVVLAYLAALGLIFAFTLLMTPAWHR